MSKTGRFVCFLCILQFGMVGFVTSGAQAGILTLTGNAIPGFNGTRTFTDGPVMPPFFNDEVTADFDFAAFAPTKFDDFLVEFSIVFDHGVPDDYYVYAYQAHVLSPTVPAAETITVGTNFSGSLGGIAPSYIPLAAYGDGATENGDEEPSLTGYQGDPITSALWEYKEEIAPGSYQGTLNPGEWTAIMFFSSVHAPTWDSAQVNAGLASGKSDFGDLAGTGVPSPAPEPSSLLLLGLSVSFIARRRKS